MENNFPNIIRTPVLIAGGGITGLSAALFLLQHDVVPLVVEKHRHISIHPRARGFDIRTMELLREISLSHPIREEGKALSPSWGILTGKSMAAAMSKRKQKKESIKFPSQLKGLESVAMLSPETGARCTQDISEPILLEAAKERGANILFGTEVLSFSQDKESVTAVIRNKITGEQQIVQAEYMIAADGAKSPARESLKMPTTGAGALGNLLNIYFEADLSAFVKGREFSILRINRPEIKGFMSSINNTDRWAFQLFYDPLKGEAPEDFTKERISGILQKVIGLPETTIRVLSILPWQPSLKVVDNMQYGRLFLAGDAAHVMTPYGGKGANTGIQDVHNLAWKLSAVIHRNAGPRLLETYNIERRPVGKYNAEKSGKMADEHGLLKKAKIRFVLPILNVMLINFFHLQSVFPKIPLLRLGYLMGLPDYRYFSSAIISGDKPRKGFVKVGRLNGLPGTRMPHLWLKREGMSTLDLTGKSFILFTGRDNELWKKVAELIRVKFKISLSVYNLEDGIDAGKINIREALGITETGALLVRPDGFVAWRNPTGNVQSLELFEKVMAWILDHEPNRHILKGLENGEHAYL